MQFRISDTFTDSLTQLTADEQTAAKTKAFDLRLNSMNPDLQFYRRNRCKDERLGTPPQRHRSPYPPPRNGRFAVNVNHHLGDEVMKVFRVNEVSA